MKKLFSYFTTLILIIGVIGLTSVQPTQAASWWNWSNLRSVITESVVSVARPWANLVNNVISFLGLTGPMGAVVPGDGGTGETGQATMDALNAIIDKAENTTNTTATDMGLTRCPSGQMPNPATKGRQAGGEGTALTNGDWTDSSNDYKAPTGNCIPISSYTCGPGFKLDPDWVNAVRDNGGPCMAQTAAEREASTQRSASQNSGTVIDCPNASNDPSIQGRRNMTRTALFGECQDGNQASCQALQSGPCAPQTDRERNANQLMFSSTSTSSDNGVSNNVSQARSTTARQASGTLDTTSGTSSNSSSSSTTGNQSSTNANQSSSTANQSTTTTNQSTDTTNTSSGSSERSDDPAQAALQDALQESTTQMNSEQAGAKESYRVAVESAESSLQWALAHGSDEKWAKQMYQQRMQSAKNAYQSRMNSSTMNAAARATALQQETARLQTALQVAQQNLQGAEQCKQELQQAKDEADQTGRQFTSKYGIVAAMKSKATTNSYTTTANGQRIPTNILGGQTGCSTSQKDQLNVVKKCGTSQTASTDTTELERQLASAQADAASKSSQASSCQGTSAGSGTSSCVSKCSQQYVMSDSRWGACATKCGSAGSGCATLKLVAQEAQTLVNSIQSRLSKLNECQEARDQANQKMGECQSIERAMWDAKEAYDHKQSECKTKDITKAQNDVNRIQCQASSVGNAAARKKCPK